MDADALLRLKVRLLTEGATLPESEWSGRKGGAGPVGSAEPGLPPEQRPRGRARRVPHPLGDVVPAGAPHPHADPNPDGQARRPQSRLDEHPFRLCQNLQSPL